MRWGSYRDFTKFAIDANSEEEAEDEQRFIDHVSERHRAFAARQIGIRLAPVIELSERTSKT